MCIVSIYLTIVTLPWGGGVPWSEVSNMYSVNIFDYVSNTYMGRRSVVVQ